MSRWYIVSLLHIESVLKGEETPYQTKRSKINTKGNIIQRVYAWGQYNQLNGQFHVITGPNCLLDKIYKLRKNPQINVIVMHQKRSVIKDLNLITLAAGANINDYGLFAVI
jgi:hypothetical protein